MATNRRVLLIDGNRRRFRRETTADFDSLMLQRLAEQAERPSNFVRQIELDCFARRAIGELH